MANLASLLIGIPFVDDGKPISNTPPLFLTPDAINVFTQIDDSLDAAPQQARTALALTNQHASIGVSSLVEEAFGLYRVSWNGQVTTPAGTNSSLMVSIVWTQNGIVCTRDGTAETGNAPDTITTGTFLIYADSGSIVSYTVTYASAGVPDMVFDLRLTVEQL